MQVLGPDDFNKKTDRLEVPVELGPDNSISVELRGKPGSWLTVRVKQEVDVDLYRAFCRWLRETNQINGSFYKRTPGLPSETGLQLTAQQYQPAADSAQWRHQESKGVQESFTDSIQSFEASPQLQGSQFRNASSRTSISMTETSRSMAASTSLGSPSTAISSV